MCVRIGDPMSVPEKLTAQRGCRQGSVCSCRLFEAAVASRSAKRAPNLAAVTHPVTRAAATGDTTVTTSETSGISGRLIGAPLDAVEEHCEVALLSVTKSRLTLGLSHSPLFELPGDDLRIIV